jgi:uncharacterized NAD-dependent epimerase/dehydratase family protein
MTQRRSNVNPATAHHELGQLALSRERPDDQIRSAGISLNTSQLTADEAARLIADESARPGLAAADPMRGGDAFDRLVDACLG